MESTTSMSPTPTSISNIGNPNHTALAERNLVSSAPLHDQSTTTISSTNNDPPQSTGRQSTQEESAMATTSMEYKRQRLEHHGYDDNALAILLNPEAQPSVKRYNPIQQQFLRWCNLHHLDAFNPDPAQLVTVGQKTAPTQLSFSEIPV
ncbi:hypothetical protein G6F43_012595 [Rhizopus delemar]|nr:hypothetical protein G6F43_012595 [Rhizopus delemar]